LGLYQFFDEIIEKFAEAKAQENFVYNVG